jgi:DNA-binding transcriptional LysR family regulator
MRAAGDELAVSHTVISRHVHNLEARLDIKLVELRGRRLVLTPEGARFHAQITRAFDTIARAAAELQPGLRNTLTVWCTPALATRRLLPRLPEFQACLPDRGIVLHPTIARPDLVRGEADAEIVYVDIVDARPELRAELLARPRMFPVASPALRARYPEVQTVKDMLRMPLIHEHSTERWERWLEAARLVNIPVLRGPRLWHAHLAIEAARLGQGVAIANEVIVDEDLATGVFVEVVPSDVMLGGYYVISTAARWNDPDIVALRAWLQGILRRPA